MHFAKFTSRFQSRYQLYSVTCLHDFNSSINRSDRNQTTFRTDHTCFSFRDMGSFTNESKLKIWVSQLNLNNNSILAHLMALFKARWFCFSISSGVFFFPNNHSMMNELWKYNTWKKMIVSFDIQCSERNLELSSSTKIELDVTMLAGSWFSWRHDHWLAMTSGDLMRWVHPSLVLSPDRSEKWRKNK